MALARTTLLSSVFMSATVCRTVASKVASSIASTPALACPRATRPRRPKKSPKNAIRLSPRLSQPAPSRSRLCFLDDLRCQAAQQTAGAHHVDQQEVHAAQNIVVIFRTHILKLAEVVQRNRHFSVSGFVELEVRCADPIVSRKHSGHDFRRYFRTRN